MEAFIVGLLLLVIGFVVATSGYPLFRITLPLMGFFAGFGVGFTATQAIFGAGAVSFVMAVLTATILGLIVASLSYFYYTLGVILVSASLFSGAFAYLGQAIGLRQEGFIVFLLAMTGAIIGTMVVIRNGLQHDFIIVLTGLFGVGMMMVGLFMLIGHVSVHDLNDQGIVKSISTVVRTSWVWLFAWLGASIIAMQSQVIMLTKAIFGDQFMIDGKKSKR